MRPQRVVLVCLVTLTLFGAACGGSAKKSSDLATSNPKAAMKEAATRTAEAKTVRLALSAVSATKVKVLDGTGSYDFVSDRGRFTLKTTLGSGADMLITPTDVYVKVPKKAAPTDPSWIKLTEADIAKANASGTGQFVESIRKQVDPRTTLTALGTSVPDFTKVGDATVRKVKTTHLRGQVDLSDAAIAKAPASQRAGLQAAQKVFGADGYPVDVWLDGDGLVRRVQYQVTSGDGSTKTTTTVTLDLFDFGKAPRIELPASSDVGDSSSLTTTTTAAK